MSFADVKAATNHDIVSKDNKVEYVKVSKL